VGIKISLLQGSATGQEVYAETHATTTNPYGLVDLQIGTGTATTGQFDTIAWGAGPYYLQLAVDLTGGANYAVMGTTQMLSVPYALYAEEGSGWEKTENGITYLGGKVGIGRTSVTGSNTNLQIGVDDPVYGGVRIFNSDSTENNQALFRIDANANLQDAFSVQRDGKVGIGRSPHPANGVQLTVGRQTESSYLAIQSDSSISSLLLTSKEYHWHLGMGADIFGLPAGSFGIKTGSSSTPAKFVFTQDGKLGIGTTDPIATLDIPVGVQNGAAVRLHSGWGNCKVLHIVEGFGSSNHFGLFIGKEDYSEAVLVTRANKVGIGTTNPTYPLTVNGTIRSKKVIVDTGWSDFVFEDDYKLMPLHEVEAFIKTNRHLPEIPSAREVEENGVSLGEISASLLQKIEELTLYTIEQQKKMDELEKKSEQQQQLIEEQGKQLKKLEKRRNRR
jgi:hypothetical protein